MTKMVVVGSAGVRCDGSGGGGSGCGGGDGGRGETNGWCYITIYDYNRHLVPVCHQVRVANVKFVADIKS